MKDFIIKIKINDGNEVGVASYSGFTWEESLREEENDRKTFTFNVLSDETDLLKYMRVGRRLTLEYNDRKNKKTDFIITQIVPVEKEEGGKDYFEITAEDYANFVFSRNNVGLNLNTMEDENYFNWLDENELEGETQDLLKYILIKGRLFNEDEQQGWRIVGDDVLVNKNPLKQKINIDLQDSNTYNALVEIALLTDSLLFFDYENKRVTLKSKDSTSFEKGFQLSPFFNAKELDVSLTGESMYPILHVEGGQDESGLFINLIPDLNYHDWEFLEEKMNEFFKENTIDKIIEQMRNRVFFDTNKIALGIWHWDERVISQIEYTPYIDSFLVAFDYFENQGLVLANEKNYQDFLKELYIELTLTNLNLQSKNIKNILIESQIRRIQSAIDLASEEVAKDRSNDYENEIHKLNSMFLEEGGEITGSDEFKSSINSYSLIEGTEKTAKEIYTDKWLFVKITAGEYTSLKDPVSEDEDEDLKGFEDWDGEESLESLTGEDNPKKVHSANGKYFYSTKIDKIDGFTFKIEEKNSVKQTRAHEIKFSPNNMSDQTIGGSSTLSDPVDNGLWEDFDKDDGKRYANKEYTVSMNEDEMWSSKPFEKENRLTFTAKGNQRVPATKEGSTSDARYAVEDHLWDLPDGVSHASYSRVKEDSAYDDNYVTIEGIVPKEIFSGWSDKRLSYPQVETFPDIPQNAEFYTLNANLTLVLINNIGVPEPVGAYVFNKNHLQAGYLSDYALKTTTNMYLVGYGPYRVFFYTDTDFMIVRETHLGVDVMYFKAGTNSVSNEGFVQLNKYTDGASFNTVAGGWYRDNVATISNWEFNPGNGRYSGDYRLDDLGHTSGGGFSVGEAKNSADTYFNMNIPKVPPLQPQITPDIKQASKTNFTVEGVTNSYNYYRFTVNYTISTTTKHRGFYYKDAGGNIMARTWDEPNVDKKAWQFASEKVVLGTTLYLIMTYEDTVLFSKAWLDFGSVFTNIYHRGSMTNYYTASYWTTPWYIVDSSTGSDYDTAYVFNKTTRITRFQLGATTTETTVAPKGNPSNPPRLFYAGGKRFVEEASRGTYMAGVYKELDGTNLASVTGKFFPEVLRMDGSISYLPFTNTFFFKRGTKSWRVDYNHQKEFTSESFSDLEDNIVSWVKDGKLPKGSLLHNQLETSTLRTYRELDWGLAPVKTPISKPNLNYSVQQADVEYAKSGFDLLVFGTRYLDLLSIFKGENYLNDLNYSYIREIDYYIERKKEIKTKLLTEEETDLVAFYDSEISAIASEIGDISGYILDGEKDLLEGAGKFWKYRTKKEYEHATELSIPDFKWKNYSLVVPGGKTLAFKFEDEDSGSKIVVIERRKQGTPEGFWEKIVHTAEDDYEISLSETMEYRSIAVFKADDSAIKKAMNSLMEWGNYLDNEGNPLADIGSSITEDHVVAFLTQSRRFTGDEPESQTLGYATRQGRLSLKQERFEHFSQERDRLALNRDKIVYSNSTQGLVVQARKEKEKVWFNMKKKYPELLLEGYYTNETESDSFNLLAQALANYKYHDSPSEEYGITYIDVQDLEGENNLVEVGDKVEVKSRLLRDLIPGSKEPKKLQVTAINKQLRDPSNIQLEINPVRKTSLPEKLLDLIKKK